MDEPCSALDPIATRRIEELMLELRGKCTIAIVTQIFRDPRQPHTQAHMRGEFS